MPTILSEDFNTSDGGWTTNADARDFTHVPLSGADGGYVEAFDRVSGDIWYFVGGAPFTGDLSLFGGARWTTPSASPARPASSTRST